MLSPPPTSPIYSLSRHPRGMIYPSKVRRVESNLCNTRIGQKTFFAKITVAAATWDVSVIPLEVRSACGLVYARLSPDLKMYVSAPRILVALFVAESPPSLARRSRLTFCATTHSMNARPQLLAGVLTPRDPKVVVYATQHIACCFSTLITIGDWDSQIASQAQRR